MRRTMSIWWVIGFIACVLVAFFAYSNQLSAEIDAAQDMLEHEKMDLIDLQAETAELELELKSAGTEAFVENQARDLYGFMMSDEIRFVISNPEVKNTETAETPSP